MELSSENCRKKFAVLRKNTRKKIDSSEFDDRDEATIDAFNDICFLAVKDDPIAQDYLAYIFKKGLGHVIPINYDKYMQWLILAGANGNEFALEKLALFLGFAINEIRFAEDFAYLATKNELTDRNLLYVVGKLLCEAIADELRLDPNLLVKEKITAVEFDPKIMRVFDRARNFAIPKVLKFLRS